MANAVVLLVWSWPLYCYRIKIKARFVNAWQISGVAYVVEATTLPPYTYAPEVHSLLVLEVVFE